MGSPATAGTTGSAISIHAAASALPGMLAEVLRSA
jgi:hypothetical protein